VTIHIFLMDRRQYMHVINLILLGIMSFFPNNNNALKLQKVRDANVLTYKYQIWNDAQWQDSLRYEYSYYADSSVVIYKKLTDNVLANDYKLTSVKNDNNEEIKLIKQIWDNGWLNSEKTLYYYNAENNLASALYKEWIDADWLATAQGSYSYDENGNLTQELWQRWVDENTMENAHVFNYSYDENNNLIELVYAVWDDEQNLINSDKKSYQYDNNLITEYLYQIWENDNWQNSYKYTYEYDNNGKLTSSLYYKWERDWNNTIFASYTYDENENLLEELWQYEYLEDTYNYSRNIFTYNASDIEPDNTDLQLIDYNLNNYPNPFNPTTTISYNLPINAKNTTIEIYNIKGKKVRTLHINSEKQGTNQVAWDGKNSDNKSVSSGIYFYKLNVNGKSSPAKKCSLLK